jgi:hypothetical protein
MASLTEVTKELQTQTKSLEEVSGGVNNLVKVIQAQIDQQKRGAGDSLEAEIKKRRAPKSSGGATTFRGGLVDAIKQDTGINFLGNLARWAFGGLTGALGALGLGRLAASFTPLLGKMVGRLITRGALGTALLLFGEDLFTKAFDYAGLEQYVTIGEEDKKLYAASLSKALSAGLIASIFGKKLGIAAFFGSLLGDSIKSMFPADMNWEEKQSLFGLEMPFTKENFLEYGAIIAAFFGPSLIRGAIGAALGFGAGGGPKGAAAESAAKAGFLKGFKPSGFKGLGWAGLLMFTGGLLADYVGEQTENQGIEDLLKISVTGLSLLALLGPTPIGIAAALAGFAIHGVLLMRDHYARKKAELDAEFEKQVAIQENKIAGLTPDATILNAMRLAEQAGQNASSGRRDGLYSGQAAKEEAYIRKVERENPDEVAKLFLQEEIGYLKGELARLTSMGSPAAADIRNQLKARLKEMESLTGQPNALPSEPIGMNTGTPLSISAMPNRDDYSRWWKKKRREDYDFKQDLKKYNMEIDSLLPPSAAFLGSGGPPSINPVNNTTNNYKIDSPGASGMGSTSDKSDKLMEAMSIQ